MILDVVIGIAYFWIETVCNKINREDVVKEYKSLDKILLKACRRLNGDRGKDLQEATNDVKIKGTNIYNSYTNLCQTLYDTINEFYEESSFEVILFGYFEEDGVEFVKAIGYGTETHEKPIAFDAKHIIKNEDEKTYFIAKLFNTVNYEKYNLNRGVKLLSKKEVTENLSYKEGRHAKDEQVEQYIVIPITNSNGEMIMALQVNCFKKLFSDEQADVIINSILRTFSSFIGLFWKETNLVTNCIRQYKRKTSVKKQM